MTSQRPGGGTKVDLGENAPVTKETAGVVPSDSLAAESQRRGGDFAENANAEPDDTSASELKSSSGAEQLSSGTTSSGGRSSTKDDTSGTLPSYDTSSSNTSSSQTGGGASESHAGTAPSYVNTQYIRDQSGPHGKNLTEGGDAFKDTEESDGISKAMNAEPGSINDPSRLAERQFQLNQNAPGEDIGSKQQELTSKTKYDGLNAETSS